MVVKKHFYTLWDDLEKFDLGQSEARPAEWNGSKALFLEKINSAIFLRDEIRLKSFRLQAEVAIPNDVGFIGFVFGAKDSANYELVYLAPVEIQYDPIMNGSMTWQIYNGPFYQKALPNCTGTWHTFTLEVHPDGALVYLGDHAEPELILTNLQHGGAVGKIGIWNFLHSYIRNLSIEEITPVPIAARSTDLQRLQSETFVTEWLVSEPYVKGSKPNPGSGLIKAAVEENGTLNINRLYKAEPGSTVEVRAELPVSEERETELSFGFSDHIHLWINEQEVFQGDWTWNPPASDGRIRPDFIRIPVRWKAGLNTIRAEITQTECFGWGLALQTGLSN